MPQKDDVPFLAISLHHLPLAYTVLVAVVIIETMDLEMNGITLSHRGILFIRLFFHLRNRFFFPFTNYILTLTT